MGNCEKWDCENEGARRTKKLSGRGRERWTTEIVMGTFSWTFNITLSSQNTGVVFGKVCTHTCLRGFWEVRLLMRRFRGSVSLRRGSRRAGWRSRGRSERHGPTATQNGLITPRWGPKQKVSSLVVCYFLLLDTCSIFIRETYDTPKHMNKQKDTYWYILIHTVAHLTQLSYIHVGQISIFDIWY